MAFWRDRRGGRGRDRRMARDAFEGIAERLARDVDRPLFALSRAGTSTARSTGLEAMQAFAERAS